MKCKLFVENFNIVNDIKPARKLSYGKDDRAMHPIYGCPENFRESLSTLTVRFPEIFRALLLRSIVWMYVQNLKFLAFPVREIKGEGAYPKIWALPEYAHAPWSSKIFTGLLLGLSLWMFRPNLKFLR